MNYNPRAKSTLPPVFVNTLNFIFFMVETKEIKRIFHDTWKLYKIQISESINTILLEHRHTHSFIYYMDCFFATTAELSSFKRPSWHSHHFTEMLSALQIALTVINWQHFECLIEYLMPFYFFYFQSILTTSKHKKQTSKVKYLKAQWIVDHYTVKSDGKSLWLLCNNTTVVLKEHNVCWH